MGGGLNMSIQKRQKLQRRVGALVLAAILVLGGCAQTVRINTEPEGADIYVNNNFIGKSPAQFRATTGTPETAYVRLVKPGYVEVKNATMDKAYRANISLLWLIPGILPYFIAAAQYEEDYLFHMKKN
jgi:hypothetical protein